MEINFPVPKHFFIRIPSNKASQFSWYKLRPWKLIIVKSFFDSTHKMINVQYINIRYACIMFHEPLTHSSYRDRWFRFKAKCFRKYHSKNVTRKWMKNNIKWRLCLNLEKLGLNAELELIFKNVWKKF